ncbi:hypothetical protein [Limnohabitans sp.]
MSVFESIAMTLLVYVGSSQLAAILFSSRQ